MLAIVVWTIGDIIELSFVGLFCFVLLGISLYQLIHERIEDFKEWLKWKKQKEKK